MSESRISSDIIKALKIRGAFAWKNHGTELTLAGLPDIIFCYKGIFAAIETKMPDKRTNVSAVQQRVHEKIRQSGGRVEVCCSVGEALRFLGTIIDDTEGER